MRAFDFGTSCEHRAALVLLFGLGSLLAVLWVPMRLQWNQSQAIATLDLSLVFRRPAHNGLSQKHSQTPGRVD